MREEGNKSAFNNKLNDLTGKEWIKFTKSWFIHRPKPRDEKILHPASFPESLVEDFIRFFTKEYQVVLDPFLGTGSTLIVCKECNRHGFGIEIIKKWADIAINRLKQTDMSKWGAHEHKTIQKVIAEKDSRNLVQIFEEDISPVLKENGLPAYVDYCITSPPYWNQLKRNYIRQKGRKEKGLETEYSDSQNDLGNIDNYEEFIFEQKKVFDGVYEIMKKGGYLTIITNNVFADGEVYPLAFDTAISLSKDEKWILKDEKIWCQDDKALIPLGVRSAYVGNRHHQYCLIFRKK